MLTKKDILIILRKAEKAHMDRQSYLKDCLKCLYDFIKNDDEVNDIIRKACAKTFFANETRVDLYFKFYEDKLPVLIDPQDKLSLIAQSLYKHLDTCGFVQYDGCGRPQESINACIGNFYKSGIFRKGYYDIDIKVWFHG